MRTFGLSEFLFIVQAAQWTLALSAIAFVGGALLGLVVAWGLSIVAGWWLQVALEPLSAGEARPVPRALTPQGTPPALRT